MTTALFLLALAFPAPAEFTINVEASRFTEWSIAVNGNRIESGETYATNPFVGTARVEVAVTFTAGDERITRTFPIELHSGYHSTFTVRVPRALPTELYCMR